MHEAVPAPRKRRSKSAAKALTVHQPKSPEQQFHEAYSEMWTKIPAISKSDKIVIRGTEIAFASYPVIRRATDAILKDHGFYMIHQGELMQSGVFVVRSYLRHIGGFYVVSELPVPIKPIPGSAMTEAQGVGNALTYGRRYNTLALLNIMSEAPQDRDVDGAAAVKIKTITKKQEAELKAAMEKTGVSIGLFAHHFLEPYGLDSLHQLPAKDFIRAMKTVEGYTPPKQQEATNEGQG